MRFARSYTQVMGPRSRAIAFIAACAGAAAAQTLEVTPNRVLIDESAAIHASGLQPGEHVSIRASLEDGGGNTWESQAEFASDDKGNIDSSKQAPVAGSYKDVSSMGLVWSMMPASKNVTVYQAPKNLGPQTIRFRLLRKGEGLATANLEQLSVAEGVVRTPVHEAGLYGVFFAPPGGVSSPGVLVVGGSEGGMPTRKAAWLASRGFAAFAVAYFHYEDLPSQLEAIPLEYFQRALGWIAARPETSGQKIAVMGTSRGGELALQLGSMFPRVAAVVAYVPANVRYRSCCGAAPRVPYAWTWQGRPLAFVLPRLRNAEMEVRAEIAVEHTQGPILITSGTDDHVWPSAEMADDIAARLQRQHFAYGFENLKYSHAGHLAGRAEIVPAWHSRTRNPATGQESDWGGSPKADAESSIDAGPKVIRFLGENLNPRR